MLRFSRSTPAANADTPRADKTTPDATLTFENVSKSFDDGTQALDDVSFSVTRGSFCSIVGPSGCGKSTILRIASRLLPHTEGTVTRPDRGLGYIFQEPTLLPWRDTAKNAELLLELRGMSRGARRRTASESLELVGLGGSEQRAPHELSGGMRMRASVARSLALDPDVFLFDEPFGAVDEITRQQLNAGLVDLFTARRFAGVFVTHSISEAVFLSTRVFVMSSRPGRLVAEFDVPYDYPRREDIRFDATFSGLCGEVSAALRAAH